MKTVPEALRPAWDRKFPGRLDWEVERLNAQGRSLDFDPAKLTEGIVQVELEWPVRDQWIRVRATFPDTYPDTRPHVQLLTDAQTWPKRHVSPLDGSLCLLGRDPRQWRPDDGLAGLLMLQLETALHGGGPEDPQGEPMEVWWNHAGLRDSYCLVDSDWDISAAQAGSFTAKLVFDPPRRRADPLEESLPAVRMAITEIRDASGQVLASWEGALPHDLERARPFTLKWARSETTLVPGRSNEEFADIRRAHAWAKIPPVSVGGKLFVRCTAVVHPIELTAGAEGDGWLVVLEWGQFRDLSSGKHAAGRKSRSRNIPVYRAGVSDLGARVPAVEALRGKRVAIAGVGALGAPIAVELARNGVAELRLLDHDTVEPGNSIRWPLGAASWGRTKVDALHDHIIQNYPRCAVQPIRHMIGGLGSPDAPELDRLLAEADLVIDASASSTVNLILWRQCQERGLPLIKVGATPEVRGGTVMAHAIGGPCPTCLVTARAAKQVETPAGSDDALRVQPIGCAEPTFVGAGFDLQELFLQAVRVAVDALGHGLTASCVYTLSLRDATAAVIPPQWTKQPVVVQPDCPSHPTP